LLAYRSKPDFGAAKSARYNVGFSKACRGELQFAVMASLAAAAFKAVPAASMRSGQSDA